MPASAATRLLDHYRASARVLPWRAPPGTARPDPYRVWLSEVMLQQTTVATVIPRFLRFVERWPSVAALAAAHDDEVLGEWAGLGYYARARNLIACARQVAENGGFPDTEAGLRALPGIGDYTAAAIAGIAFGRDSVAIDTNVERVVARLGATSDKAAIRAAAAAMVPAGQAGDFAQAMMDLGATICRPRRPACGDCPLARDCRARALGMPEAFPVKAERKARPVRFGVAWWIERDGAVWLVRRPGTGLLGGMAALPGREWGATSTVGPVLAEVRHGFTHFELRLTVIAWTLPECEGWWHPIDRLTDAGLPTLYRRAVEAVLDQRKQLAA
ncbi:MAG: A/G-specific adenine glycosylase [Sphingomonas bacterium]|nr:A/G-specific adenine glycosylase [Sphingomonas bacterium]